MKLRRFVTLASLGLISGTTLAGAKENAGMKHYRVAVQGKGSAAK
jgi:hypothetical protein